jgi:predicted short-subunit dehydrogenase-like oxidoreductase (DUF2520 family)
MLHRMDASEASPITGPRPDRPRVGIVGAGHVGIALGAAIDRAGWPVVAIASRDAGRRARFLERVPGALAVPDAHDLPETVDLVLLAVPDDIIPDVAAGLRVRDGQGVVHTSGALSASVLDGVRVRGASVAGFHPLVPFADTEGALRALPGAVVAIEGDAGLVALLRELAVDLGAAPIVVSAAGKAAYHAAAVLAAGGLIALLDTIAELGKAAGLSEPAAVAAYLPLIERGLVNAQAMGVAAALTGPYVRGDTGTVRLHLDTLDRLAPSARDMYLAAARRQVEIARAAGRLDEHRAAELRRLVDGERGD